MTAAIWIRAVLLVVLVVVLLRTRVVDRLGAGPGGRPLPPGDEPSARHRVPGVPRSGTATATRVGDSLATRAAP